jgi:hypothetical protein
LTWSLKTIELKKREVIEEKTKKIKKKAGREW